MYGEPFSSLPTSDTRATCSLLIFTAARGHYDTHPALAQNAIHAVFTGKNLALLNGSAHGFAFDVGTKRMNQSSSANGA